MKLKAEFNITLDLVQGYKDLTENEAIAEDVHTFLKYFNSLTYNQVYQLLRDSELELLED